MNNRTLKIMITCRDRIHLTQKTIESIYENTKLFSNIDIYCFDNLSELDIPRMEYFQNLLKNDKIVHYSYDTTKSLSNCFGKAVLYRRWLDMINLENSLKFKFKKIEETYYLLIDNDMIVCPKWDEFFLSAIKYSTPTTHFLVKYPGGTTKLSAYEKGSEIKNEFNNNEKIKIVFGLGGGGSGFWFMNDNMIKKHMNRWTYLEISETYSKFKRHDSTMWNSIIKSTKSMNPISYLIRVVPSYKEFPLVLHLGGKIGSICNSLTEKRFNKSKVEFEKNEKEIKNMSVTEIIKKFNIEECRRW